MASQKEAQKIKNWHTATWALWAKTREDFLTDRKQMRYVITKVNIKNTVFWDVMPCTFIDRNHLLWRTYCLHLRGRSYFSYTEDVGSRFLRNVGEYLITKRHIPEDRPWRGPHKSTLLALIFRWTAVNNTLFGPQSRRFITIRRGQVARNTFLRVARSRI
jgi:hypothetical protein